MTCFFQSDLCYRRFLAAHPGIWAEVGAFDDPSFLRLLIAERRALGLPRRSGIPIRVPRSRHRRTAALPGSWAFAPSRAEIGV